MKRNILLTAMMLAAGSLLAADLKDEITGAAKKLAESDSYSWKQTSENAGGGGGGGGGRRGGFGGGPMEGKIQKDGLMLLTITRGDTTQEVVLKGKKGAAKTEDGWKSLEEIIADDSGGRGAGQARMLQNIKAPALALQDTIAHVKEFTKTDDTYSGDFTEEGAKAMMTFGGGRRGGGGGNAPEISGAKGSLKVWAKDGVISKYQVKVQGTMSRNGNDIEINRTTTTEIKEVGTTKVSPPDEATKKLS